MYLVIAVAWEKFQQAHPLPRRQLLILICGRHGDMMASLFPYVSTSYQCVRQGDEAEVESYRRVATHGLSHLVSEL